MNILPYLLHAHTGEFKGLNCKLIQVTNGPWNLVNTLPRLLHVCSGLGDLNALNTYTTDKETYLTMVLGI